MCFFSSIVKDVREPTVSSPVLQWYASLRHLPHVCHNNTNTPTTNRFCMTNRKPGMVKEMYTYLMITCVMNFLFA